MKCSQYLDILINQHMKDSTDNDIKITYIEQKVKIGSPRQFLLVGLKCQFKKEIV
ncbi:hypothetical protein BGM25_24895 [Bacillus sp. FJAT-29953]|nr:hypothetical protein [Bacillus sp. FJAT-29953]